MHAYDLRKPAALLATFVATAFSLFVPLAARAGDGAGIGVARIGVIQGDVTVQRGDSATPVAAAINAPVLGADYVITGDASRAEIQFDGSSMVRLGANVQLRFTHLERGDRALQLAQGTIELRLLRSGGRSAVDTPSVTVRPRQSGSYRITVTGDGASEITVRAGEASIVTPQGERIVTPGTTLIARGPAVNPALEAVQAIALDDFDRFNTERDERHERALASASYVDRDIVGVDDLGAYGRWVNDGSNGNVWVPANVAAGWAPYRNGRWVWEDRYGWTWVGYEPWGWAPYHYGRWYRSTAYGWCWFPPSAAYPVAWQPGLVAFFGFGDISLGFGTIGWVPLAPFEPYYPWWGRGGNTTIVNNVTSVYNVYGNGNAVNGGIISRIYKNAPYGTTAQPNQRFLLGRFDHPMRVLPGELAHAQVVRGTLPVVPTTANLRFSDAAAMRVTVPNPALQRRAFAGDAVVVHRTPFEDQRAAVAALARLRPQSAHAPIVITGGDAKVAPEPVIITTTRAHGTNDAWARFGERRGTAVTAHGAAASGATFTTTATVPLTSNRAFERMPHRTPGDPEAIERPAMSRPAIVRPLRRETEAHHASAAPPATERYAPPPERRAPVTSRPAETHAAPGAPHPVSHQPG